ncbi:MAG TPA: alpha/beta hydrolase [Gemmatimonadaceae bacterium]|nr:alpha/beta hydrolase [Gemmatimonadaceae bacterium]
MRTAVAAALLATLGSAAAAQHEPIPLWPHAAPGAVGDSSIDRPTITPYLASGTTATRTGVVVFPGGGYEHLAIEKEGTKIAEWLNGMGVNAFVVTYRLGPRYHHPTMLADGQRAVRLVRANAARWNLDPDAIGVMGFSAGGHLASALGTHADTVLGAPDSVDLVSTRPDFMVLAYPVITMDERWAHAGSRRNLLGNDPSPALVHALSNETQVTARTPPTFLVATSDDSTVPVQNSLMFYEALLAAHVPAELHLFQTGRHGFGLAAGDESLSQWPRLCEEWMRRNGWLSSRAHVAR